MLGLSVVIDTHPADTRRWINVGFTLIQRRRRWTNVKPTLTQRLVSAGHPTKRRYFTSHGRRGVKLSISIRHTLSVSSRPTTLGPNVVSLPCSLKIDEIQEFFQHRNIKELCYPLHMLITCVLIRLLLMFVLTMFYCFRYITISSPSEHLAIFSPINLKQLVWGVVLNTHARFTHVLFFQVYQHFFP